MKIIDPENLIPYHSVLNRVVKTHPFSPNLYQQIHTITVSEDDSEIINPRISFNHETCGVTLYVVSQLYRRNNCDYILYHEFGHIADRLNPNFGYSDEKKSSLTDIEQYALMEVWNLYIDSRLNHYGLFQLGENDRSVYCLINGRLQILPYSIEGRLLRYISSLRSSEVKNADSMVKEIWKNPLAFRCYSELISLIK